MHQSTMDGRTDGRMNERMDGRTIGQADGRMEGQTDGCTNGLMDGQTKTLPPPLLQNIEPFGTAAQKDEVKEEEEKVETGGGDRWRRLEEET